MVIPTASVCQFTRKRPPRIAMSSGWSCETQELDQCGEVVSALQNGHATLLVGWINRYWFNGCNNQMNQFDICLESHKSLVQLLHCTHLEMILFNSNQIDSTLFPSFKLTNANLTRFILYHFITTYNYSIQMFHRIEKGSSSQPYHLSLSKVADGKSIQLWFRGVKKRVAPFCFWKK